MKMTTCRLASGTPGQWHAWPVWALSSCSPECGSAATEGGRAVHFTRTGHVFIPGRGLDQVSQNVGRMEMRGLSDLGPAHPQAQKQSGKKRCLKDFRGGPAVGTQSFQCPGLGSIPGGGG